jgi:hypothetical protein
MRTGLGVWCRREAKWRLNCGPANEKRTRNGGKGRRESVESRATTHEQCVPGATLPRKRLDCTRAPQSLRLHSPSANRSQPQLTGGEKRGVPQCLHSVAQRKRRTANDSDLPLPFLCICQCQGLCGSQGPGQPKKRAHFNQAPLRNSARYWQRTGRHTSRGRRRGQGKGGRRGRCCMRAHWPLPLLCARTHAPHCGLPDCANVFFRLRSASRNSQTWTVDRARHPRDHRGPDCPLSLLRHRAAAEVLLALPQPSRPRRFL